MHNIIEQQKALTPNVNSSKKTIVIQNAGIVNVLKRSQYNIPDSIKAIVVRNVLCIIYAVCPDDPRVRQKSFLTVDVDELADEVISQGVFDAISECQFMNTNLTNDIHNFTYDVCMSAVQTMKVMPSKHYYLISMLNSCMDTMAIDIIDNESLAISYANIKNKLLVHKHVN